MDVEKIYTPLTIGYYTNVAKPRGRTEVLEGLRFSELGFEIQRAK